ncbi:UNVERIFIED_CONTAM: autophagy protein atg9 [Siphonaria sp. JEL0065]|nr:autophagy protein atg9 [Siphonaria sp. JEL0065]
MLAIVDQELTEFEITPGKSALFYITLFGGLLAGLRGMIPEETRLFEPESLLKQVIEETHHLPDSWRTRLHTIHVKNEFSTLFDLKIKEFVLEIVSILIAPFILYYSLPSCAEGIIDIFRDYTVDMEGVGFVCSFSAFDLARHGNPRYGVPALNNQGDGDFVSKEGKMEQSFLYFKANYPQWDVGVDGSQYLQALSRSATVQRQGVFKGEASILLDGGGTGTMRSRKGVKFGGQLVAPPSGSGGGVGNNNGFRIVTESRLGLSEIESSVFGGDGGGEEEPVGLFGILDAVYDGL